MATNVRPLSSAEATHIANVLTRLRDHFRVWPVESGKEWYLVDFAYYEGCGRRDECCVETLREAAPVALGSTLVNDHDFEWCVIQTSNSARIAVRHPQIPEPFDLYALDATPMIVPDDDDDTESLEPGEGAHESIHAILNMIGQSVAGG